LILEYGKKFLYFIGKLKTNQETGLQASDKNRIEISASELFFTQTTIFARYPIIELVGGNRAWITRFIIAA
jgi:hypothetical protein